jgi:hypothetical protein
MSSELPDETEVSGNRFDTERSCPDPFIASASTMKVT